MPGLDGLLERLGKESGPEAEPLLELFWNWAAAWSSSTMELCSLDLLDHGFSACNPLKPAALGGRALVPKPAMAPARWHRPLALAGWPRGLVEIGHPANGGRLSTSTNEAPVIASGLGAYAIANRLVRKRRLRHLHRRWRLPAPGNCG